MIMYVCHVDEGAGCPTHVNRLDGWVTLQLMDHFGRSLELVLAMDMKLIGWHVLSSQTRWHCSVAPRGELLFVLMLL